MRERGFVMYVVLAIAAVAALAVLVGQWNDFVSGIDGKGYARGVQETSAAYEKRDNEKLVRALARVKELEAAAAAAEARKQGEVDAAVAKAEKEKRNVQDRYDRMVAGLRDGTFRLRDPGARPKPGPGCAGGGGGALGEAAGDPAGGAGRDGGGELSGEAGAFLLGEARRADQVTSKLRLCRETLKADRAR